MKISGWLVLVLAMATWYAWRAAADLQQLDQTLSGGGAVAGSSWEVLKWVVTLLMLAALVRWLTQHNQTPTGN
jgi:hypothetical protein